ncbi:MAG: hypothetical protein LBV72_09450 [Tannerella sp.]|jgi:deferrochelatase/peroxidase EfeB|nr:hypothetical protein [Tannerella sp.]
MAMFSFYKMRKPRQFDHKPIYWDPRKEALEERIRKVERELDEKKEVDLENYKPSIKGSFIEGTSHLKKSKAKGDTAQDRVYKNMRLLLILAVAVVIFWILFIR